MNVQFIHQESFSVGEFELSCVEKLNGYTRPTRFGREPRIFYRQNHERIFKSPALRMGLHDSLSLSLFLLFA